MGGKLIIGKVTTFGGSVENARRARKLSRFAVQKNTKGEEREF
jgi:hypothetical protein